VADRAAAAVARVVRAVALAALGQVTPPPARKETPEEWMARMAPVVEGLVFAADHPLAVKEITAVLLAQGEEMAGNDLVLFCLERIRDRYVATGAGIVLTQVANGWAMRTADVVTPFLRRAHEDKPFKMGRAALETLAIMAYRQPVTKPQVDDLRGVDSANAVKTLLDRQLIRVLGKSEEVGRPLLYGTTKVFLEAFNLKALSDLPTLREYQELSAENQALVDAQAPARDMGRIRDLAVPGARIISEQVESEGMQAMAELESAMGSASATGRTAEAILTGGGKLPPGVKVEDLKRVAAARAAADAAVAGEGAEPGDDNDLEGEAAREMLEQAAAPTPTDDDDDGDEPREEH
jgi:segregation and condensation protein B